MDLNTQEDIDLLKELTAEHELFLKAIHKLKTDEAYYINMAIYHNCHEPFLPEYNSTNHFKRNQQ